MGVAVGLDGRKWDVPSIIGRFGELDVVHKPVIDQRLTTSASLRKGSHWRDPTFWGWEIDIGNRREWLLAKVEHLEDGRKKLHFQPIIEEKEGKKPDPEEFAKLVKDLKLTDENLRGLLETMLVNVFVERTLKKLLAAEEVEFIMDKEDEGLGLSWIYLRADDTAYRV